VERDGDWYVVEGWLVRDPRGDRSIPAFEFRRSIPESAKQQLLAIVDAVALTGPDQGRDSNTHCAMRDGLSHLHEARDRHGQTPYRLFLRWQREHHRVVLMDGRTKPNATALNESEYMLVRDLAATADDEPPPFATADDFARELPRDTNP
jgi:hypothetical protein